MQTCTTISTKSKNKPRNSLPQVENDGRLVIFEPKEDGQQKDTNKSVGQQGKVIEQQDVGVKQHEQNARNEQQQPKNVETTMPLDIQIDVKGYWSLGIDV